MASSRSLAEVCRKLGLCVTGGNRATLVRHMSYLLIDHSHVDGRKVSLDALNAAKGCNKKPVSDWLVVDSKAKTARLKMRLIEEGVLHEICCGCGCGPVWNGKKLVLQLDHKNGINTDCRLENLELLCPN